MKKEPGRHNQGSPKHNLGGLYVSPEQGATRFRESAFVLYDLRDPAAWKRAHEERGAWGRERSKIPTLDNDHVVIEFAAGGVQEPTA